MKEEDPMVQIDEVRPSPIAGTWYAGSPDVLTEQVNHFLSEARPPVIHGKIIGLVVPHAGHRYSGPTAAYAYRLVQGLDFDLVIIISPSHAYYPGEVITSAHLSYATPLGRVSIHPQALSQFEQAAEKEKINFEKVAYDEEHSIEIQLPFLQRTLEGNFQLLPLMMRSQSLETVTKTAKCLVPILKKYRCLLVASSDLSHFYPQDIADALDEEMLRRIESFSPEKVLEAEANGAGSACGAGPIAAVLIAARAVGADHVKILHHSTSGDVTGDLTSVVGYGAAVIYARDSDSN